MSKLFPSSLLLSLSSALWAAGFTSFCTNIFETFYHRQLSRRNSFNQLLNFLFRIKCRQLLNNFRQCSAPFKQSLDPFRQVRFHPVHEYPPCDRSVKVGS